MKQIACLNCGKTFMAPDDIIEDDFECDNCKGTEVGWPQTE